MGLSWQLAIVTALGAILWQPSLLATADPLALQTVIATGSLHTLQKPDFRSFRDSVARFYADRDQRPAWLKDNRPTAQATRIIAVLEQSETKGLDPRDYDGENWQRRLAALSSSSQTDQADFELALTISLIRYVSDLRDGRIRENRFRAGLRLDQEGESLAGWIQTNLVAARDPEVALRSLEPPFAAYWRLQHALVDYQRLSRQNTVTFPLQLAGTVRRGETWAGIPQVARLLCQLGDLPENPLQRSEIYTEALVAAVKRFQRRHGLAETGELTKVTIGEMNVPLSRRVRQIALTLERWRWVPHSFSAPPVVVNIPEFELRALDTSYRTALQMKVVVGNAYGHKTPVFAAEMKYLVFRPYWEVPPSIARRELVPKFHKNPSFLVINHYEIVDQSGGLVTRETVTGDILDGIQAGRYRVRQAPGAHNALGGVKFLFPNEHNVYLHGTPLIELFEKTRRDFSHGCIRVERPRDLAAWVLKDKPDWTGQRIDEAMTGRVPVTVVLAKPIPVLIVYGTALVLESGEVHFFDDIYGQDAALQKAIDEREL